ncbi:hypothetical protein MTR_8g067580 [Medicago truncatula]|uniref:Uncharacterized protein n=1 Tax=Medicago truncatula TaxID=3880 RepID=G7LHT6_MEDTR|nr:hypothetical protein MTR_8g067580 [Medicago truncatula]
MSDKRSYLVKNPTAETRTDCKFVKDDYHNLQFPQTTHMLASHLKISEVQTYGHLASPSPIFHYVGYDF